MRQARIIYVTGMKPKPDPVLHRAELIRVLHASLARVDARAANWLTGRDDNFVLVSWTPLLYQEQRDIALDRPGIEQLLAQPYPSVADKREADALQRKLYRAWHLLGDSFPWLTGLMATANLRVTLADVRRYLDDIDGVATRVRQELIRELDPARCGNDSVLLIGHSLGSVIAYDCLWHLSRRLQSSQQIDLLMTLGSPLATRFIRKHLAGADRQGADRYPANVRHWLNLAARGEKVALHRRLRPFFAPMIAHGLLESMEDIADIYNHFRDAGGLNPHKSYGYLNHRAVAERICGWLDYSS